MKRTGRIPMALRGGLRRAVACGWIWAAGALAATPGGTAAPGAAQADPRARLADLERALDQARANATRPWTI
jgi:hypothetical protein